MSRTEPWARAGHMCCPTLRSRSSSPGRDPVESGGKISAVTSHPLPPKLLGVQGGASAKSPESLESQPCGGRMGSRPQLSRLQGPKEYWSDSGESTNECVRLLQHEFTDAWSRSPGRFLISLLAFGGPQHSSGKPLSGPCPSPGFSYQEPPQSPLACEPLPPGAGMDLPPHLRLGALAAVPQRPEREWLDAVAPTPALRMPGHLATSQENKSLWGKGIKYSLTAC